MHATTSAPPAVSEGNTLVIPLVFENHLTAAQTVYLILEIRIGAAHWTSGVIAWPLPPSGLASLPVQLPVAPGSAGGGPLDVEFTWSAYDNQIALDQWRHVVVINP